MRSAEVIQALTSWEGWEGSIPGHRVGEDSFQHLHWDAHTPQRSYKGPQGSIPSHLKGIKKRMTRRRRSHHQCQRLPQMLWARSLGLTDSAAASSSEVAFVSWWEWWRTRVHCLRQIHLLLLRKRMRKRMRKRRTRGVLRRSFRHCHPRQAH